EPVIPLHMFGVRTFNRSPLAALLTSIVMFGTIAYIPTYLQMAEGYDATTAGLLMIPMMAGLMGTSVIIGQAVTRTGRTRIYPIVGAVVLTVEIGRASCRGRV